MKSIYCAHCGTKLKINAEYCHNCGTPVAQQVNRSYMHHYEVRCPAPTLPKHLPVSCMLAYIPTLFWLPLATDSEDDTHRKCANQGLWLTLLSILLGIAFIGGGIVIYQNGMLDLSHVGLLFTDWNASNWLERLPSALLCQAILPFVLFVPINSMCGFFHGMSSDKPYRVPLVGRIRLIRERTHGARTEAAS